MCVPGAASEDPEVAAVLARRPGPKARARAEQLAGWLAEGGKERLDAELARERAESEAALQAMAEQAEAEGWYDDPALNGYGPPR